MGASNSSMHSTHLLTSIPCPLRATLTQLIATPCLSPKASRCWRWQFHDCSIASGSSRDRHILFANSAPWLISQQGVPASSTPPTLTQFVHFTWHQEWSDQHIILAAIPGLFRYRHFSMTRTDISFHAGLWLQFLPWATTTTLFAAPVDHLTGLRAREFCTVS